MRLAMETGRQQNPVDVIELVAATREWAFERPCDDEIAVSVRGLWTDYAVAFSWIERVEALHLACSFALKVPARREVEVLRLLARINERLMIGHFDLLPSEGSVVFRHSLLLAGGLEPTGEQVEQLLACALRDCERYYEAFQHVVWAERPAGEALAAAAFDTVGNA